MVKQRIRLTESQLHRVIKESVKRVLNEAASYEHEPPYYWSISRCNEDFESLECVEDSATSHDASKDEFDTPEEAYKDGLRNLQYYNDDFYCVEVYFFTSSGAGGYVEGYRAENDHGNISEY